MPPKFFTLLKAEFKLEKFKWSNTNPEDFFLIQWQTTKTVSTTYVIQKMVQAAFFTTLLWSSSREASYKKKEYKYECVKLESNVMIIFAYLTSWVFLMALITSIWSCFLVVRQYYLQDEENSEQSFYNSRGMCISFRIFHSMTMDMVLSIMFVFSVSVLWYEKKVYFGVAALMHYWVGIVLLSDFTISRYPLNFLHVYASILVALTYICFNYVYYLGGGYSIYKTKYLYKIMNWEQNPWLAVVSFLYGIIVIVVGRFLLFGLFVLRQSIFEAFYKEKEENPEEEQTT